jgi:hypothetical protein
MANPVDALLAQANYGPQDYKTNGFVVAPIPSADGNGLPSSKIVSQRQANIQRNIAHWFVPEVGVVNMYINPQSIDYTHEKVITQERTKGGYILQYWGEELTKLRISGNTGSSGIEGINVLYEIYRAEQYMFDPIALTMAADNSIPGLNDLVDNALGNFGGLTGLIGAATGGVLGINPASQNVLPRDPPSLATMAFGIELYYSGWVFRGYFKSFSFNESVDHLGLFTYNIDFVVTQRRGYRVNTLPWQRSAINGPSNNDSTHGTPLSIQGLITNPNPTPPNNAVATSNRGAFAGPSPSVGRQATSSTSPTKITGKNLGQF